MKRKGQEIALQMNENSGIISFSNFYLFLFTMIVIPNNYLYNKGKYVF